MLTYLICDQVVYVCSTRCSREPHVRNLDRCWLQCKNFIPGTLFPSSTCQTANSNTRTPNISVRLCTDKQYNKLHLVLKLTKLHWFPNFNVNLLFFNKTTKFHASMARKDGNGKPIPYSPWGIPLLGTGMGRFFSPGDRNGENLSSVGSDGNGWPFPGPDPHGDPHLQKM